jgi:hypothetical protein
MVSIPAPAQTTGDTRTANGLHVATFRLPQGSVTVNVPADAAAGDTIAGTVVAAPAGDTPQQRDSNLGELNGFVVDWQGEPASVPDGRYRWTIPTAARSGAVALVLRDRGGRSISQAAVPVSPFPVAPDARSSAPFELPVDGQAGQPAIVRGATDGTLQSVQITVGEHRADVIAVSPRQVVFRVPDAGAGVRPLRVTREGRTQDGQLRVLRVRLTATGTPLQLMKPGQKATVTITADGLQGIAQPATLTLVNTAPDVVQLQNGPTQIVEIEPNAVRRDGTFVLTRGLTGIRVGGFNINARLALSPLSRFDVTRTVDRALASWTVNTGIQITPDARALIARSVADARRPLDEFLRRQQLYQNDVVSVLDRLLSHYCFDLRDENLTGRGGGRALRLPGGRSPRDRLGVTPSRVEGSGQAMAGTRLVLASLRQPAAAQITTENVRRLSFSQFLSQLIARFSTSEVGYLLIRSTPAQAAITIDGQRKTEVTNRTFVTSVGDHGVVVVGGPNMCRQMVTVAPYQTRVIDCPP